MKRATLLTTIAGGVFILLGLILLASTLGNAETQDARAGALLAIAFGCMVIAVPMYIDARRIVTVQKESKQAALRKGSRCILCGDEVASFYCTNHSVGVCLSCLPDHHDANLCLYRPIIQQLASTPANTPVRPRA